jgi:hypothetical protein
MTQNFDTEKVTPSIAPLRMRKPDGSPYCRPKETEAALAILLQLPASELLARARIEDSENSDYVPSECVLYFVRRPTFNDESVHRDLFIILRNRVLRAVPVRGQRLPGSTKVAEKAADLEVREAVLHKFQEMLCGDRGEYDDRLDFYECRFNQALALLRATARRDARREQSHYEPMSSDADTKEASREGENPLDDQNVDFLYRSKLRVAISSLPVNERRVIELMLEGLPIDSEDKDVITIAKTLGCVEKTVRNRRDRAFEKLRDALKEEEDV